MEKKTFCYNSRRPDDSIETCMYGEVKAYSLELARALVLKICHDDNEILINVWEKQ